MLSHLFHGKVLFWITLSTFLTPCVTYIQAYLFCDWEFLNYLIILMVVDTVTGFFKYLKLRLVSSTGFAKLIKKILAYFSVLILTHVLTHFKIDGSINLVFFWFDDFAFSALMVREGISILENIGYLFPGILPKWLLGKLKEFDSTGNFKTK